MSNRRRKFRLLADARMQGGLCLRVICYWLLFEFALTAAVLFRAALDGSIDGGIGQVWQLLAPALLVSSLMLPVAMLDMLVYSNRFAGPLRRLRRNLQELAAGQEVPPLRFRRRDFLGDVSDDFNALRERLCSRAGVRAPQGAQQQLEPCEMQQPGENPAEAHRQEHATSELQV